MPIIPVLLTPEQYDALLSWPKEKLAVLIALGCALTAELPDDMPIPLKLRVMGHFAEHLATPERYEIMNKSVSEALLGEENLIAGLGQYLLQIGSIQRGGPPPGGDATKVMDALAKLLREKIGDPVYEEKGGPDFPITFATTSPNANYDPIRRPDDDRHSAEDTRKDDPGESANKT